MIATVRNYLIARTSRLGNYVFVNIYPTCSHAWSAKYYDEDTVPRTPGNSPTQQNT